MPLFMVQGNRIVQVLIISVVVLSLFFTFSFFGHSTLSEGAPSSGPDNVKVKSTSGYKTPAFNFGSRTPPQAKPKPANATLDFQEIIYLSMPYRTDRQDALSLIAAAAGLKLTMMPGVSVHSNETTYFVTHLNPSENPRLHPS
jgi:hypothetical protein